MKRTPEIEIPRKRKIGWRPTERDCVVVDSEWLLIIKFEVWRSWNDKVECYTKAECGQCPCISYQRQPTYATQNRKAAPTITFLVNHRTPHNPRWSLVHSNQALFLFSALMPDFPLRERSCNSVFFHLRHRLTCSVHQVIHFAFVGAHSGPNTGTETSSSLEARDFLVSWEYVWPKGGICSLTGP